MRKCRCYILMMFFLITTQVVYAQVHSHEWWKFKDLAFNYCASFCVNPQDHSNTVEVENGLKMINDALLEQLEKKGYLMSIAPNKAEAKEWLEDVELVYYLTGNIGIITGFITGKDRGSFDAAKFDIVMKPILAGMGWVEKQIPVSSPYITAIEYKMCDFKMLIVKYNREVMLGKPSWVKFKAYSGSDTSASLEGYVRAGTYKIVQFKDDTQSKYIDVTKVEASVDN